MPVARRWLILPVFFCLLWIAASWLYINKTLEAERQAGISALQARAESLLWAIGGAARYFGHGRHGGAFAEIFNEIGRQPGVAWVALVDRDGKIILDSDVSLIGQTLYTARELAELAPGQELAGRISPDEPNIYETWLEIYGHGRFKNGYIFAGLDCAGFQESLTESRRRLIFLAVLAGACLAAMTLLSFYIRSYRLSRRELAKAQAVSGQVISNFPAALLVASADGKILLYNQKAQEIFGGLKVADSLASLPGLDWTGWLAEAQSQPVIERECALLGKGKEIRLTCSPISESSGKQIAWLFILQDLSEVNSLKEKLARARQLAATGKLAAGFAHEIRNPLSSICGYAHYLEQRLVKDPLGAQAARLLVEEGQRLNSALADLLNLSRPQTLNIRETSLASLLEKARYLLKPDAEAKNITIELLIAKDLPKAFIDGDKFLQAVLNLLLNALQATPAGGCVIIEAAKEGQVFKISFKDNGPGMDSGTLNQIFNPYFTTKAQGSGLGLPMTRQIVESHGGSVRAAAAPGKGSEFVITVPIKRIDVHAE